MKKFDIYRYFHLNRNRSHSTLNDQIEKQCEIDSTDDIVAYEKGGRKYSHVILSRDNYRLGFEYPYWAKLSFEEKARITKWVVEDYLAQFNIEAPKIIFLPENQILFDYEAFYCDNTITINPEIFMSFDGLSFLNTIIHESIHAHDFADMKKYLNELRAYVDPKFYESTKKFQEAIFRMPISGKIYNYKTGAEEPVVNELRAKILLVKNMIVSINPESSIPKTRKEIRTPAHFANYLSNILYFSSPIEKRAYTQSYFYANMLHNCNIQDFPKLYKDNMLLDNAENVIHRINGYKTQLKSIFKISYPEILDMFLIARYNFVTYKDNTEKYICKDIMQKREILMARAWESSFCSKGEYQGEGLCV